LDEMAGSGQLKVYFIVDRREFLEKVKTVYASYATWSSADYTDYADSIRTLV